jgi:hypothetical protein
MLACYQSALSDSWLTGLTASCLFLHTCLCFAAAWQLWLTWCFVATVNVHCTLWEFSCACWSTHGLLQSLEQSKRLKSWYFDQMKGAHRSGDAPLSSLLSCLDSTPFTKGQCVHIIHLCPRMSVDPVDYTIDSDDHLIMAFPGLLQRRLLSSSSGWTVQPDLVSLLESTRVG